jgi:arylsulfatase A-like enzyme
MEMFRNKPLQLPPNVPASTREKEGYTETVRAYYAQVANLDFNIGKLLAALEETGQLDNTIIFYFSDHGEMLGSHGHMGKSRPQTESSRIPLIVRYPKRVAAGHVSQELISGVDFFPTLLGLLGVQSPDYAEGTDLSGLLTGQGSGAEEVLLQFEHNFYEPNPAQTFRSFIRGGWQYTCYLEKGPTELIFLKTDPYQLDNKLNQAETADIQAAMHEALCRKLTSLNDDFMERMQAINT